MVSVCTALYYTSLAYGTQNEIAVEVFSTAQPAQIPTVDDALAFCMTDTQYSLSLESFSVAAVVSGGDQLAAPVGQAGVLSSQGSQHSRGSLRTFSTAALITTLADWRQGTCTMLQVPYAWQASGSSSPTVHKLQAAGMGKRP